MLVLTVALAVSSTSQLIVTKVSDTSVDGIGMLSTLLWHLQGKLCAAQSSLSFRAFLYVRACCS